MTSSGHMKAAELADAIVTYPSSSSQPAREAEQAQAGEQSHALPFLTSLFALLERSGARYCVLHSHQVVPRSLATDLDIAIHRADASKFSDVCCELAHQGYIPVQCLNYAVGSNYVVFAWFDGSELQTAAIDVATEHRRCGLVLAENEELICNRGKATGFWVASAQTEFSYLLSKTVLKGSMKTAQEARVRELAELLGRQCAEELASRLFGTAAAHAVVASCIAGSAREIVRRYHTRLWLTVFAKNPLKAISSWVSEVPRIWRRLWRPTGLLITVLGVDGVGKSTLLDGLGAAVGNCFRSRRSVHWHPSVFPSRKHGPNPDPQGQIIRGPALSIFWLLLHFLDCWTAYLLQVRPILTRSGLVLFDRYFHDILVDRHRYRYGGPSWLATAVCARCPKPDLALVLDAPESVSFSRKPELGESEMARQRQEYIKLASRLPNTFIIDCNRPKSDSVAGAASITIQHLALRLSATRPEFRHSVVVPTQVGGGHPAIAPSRARILTAVTQIAGGKCALHSIQQDRTTIITVGQPPAASAPSQAGSGASMFARKQSLAIVPSKNNPRLLLPCSSRRTLIAGFEVCSPYAYNTRLLMKLLHQMARAGCYPLAADRIQLLSSGPLALETVVTEVTGEPRPVFSIWLSRPTAYAKLTVQAMRPDGETLGYIKLPLTSKASLRLRHEAAVLRELQSFSAVGSRVPAVRSARDWCDGYMLFQSSLKGRQAPARFTALNQTFLDLLQPIAPVERDGGALVDEVAARWEQIETSTDPEWRRLCRTALEFTYRELSGTAVHCGFVHGDFAPWNMRISAGGQLLALDWECAAWNLPGIWDRFHFDVQSASLLHAADPRILPESRALFILYLIYSTSQLIDEGAVLNSLGVSYRKQAVRRLVALDSTAAAA